MASPKAANNPAFQKFWVLLIDISGFSDRVSDLNQRENVVAAYRAIIDDVLPNLLTVEVAKAHFEKSTASKLFGAELSPEERSREIDKRWSESLRIFSDSIFVFFGNMDRSPAAASFLLGAAADEISAALWRNRLPHRGSIAFGECYVDPRRDIFLGTPIVEAHRWEQSQKWLGISISPGSLYAARTNSVKSGIGIDRRHFELEASIPTADGEVTTWAVNPFTERDGDGRNTAVREKELRGFLECFDRAERTGKASIISKYVNTARFLRTQGLDSRRLRAVAGEPTRERIVVSALHDGPNEPET